MMIKSIHSLFLCFFLFSFSACQHQEKQEIIHLIEDTYFELGNLSEDSSEDFPVYNFSDKFLFAWALSLSSMTGNDFYFEAQNVEVISITEKMAEVKYDLFSHIGSNKNIEPIEMTLKKIGGEWKLDGQKFLGNK